MQKRGKQSREATAAIHCKEPEATKAAVKTEKTLHFSSFKEDTMAAKFVSPFLSGTFIESNN